MEEADKTQTKIDSDLKLLAKSSFIVFITILLSKIIIYLYRILIARYYGASIYGLFVLSVMLVGWFRIFSSFGLREGILRYASLFRGKNEEEKIKYIFRISFFISILTSILASILLFYFSDFIAVKVFSTPNLTLFLKIFSLTLPFTVLSGIFLPIIRAFEKIGWFSFITNILGNFVQLLALLLLIFLGLNSTAVPISYLIGIISVFIVSYFISKIILSKISHTKENIKDEKVFTKLFSYSWPFIFSGVISFIFYWVDSFMLGVFKTAEQVGIYNAAVPIAMLLLFPLNLFVHLFFPIVAKEYSKGNLEIVKQLSQQVGKWIFMITLPFFIIFIIFPGELISLFFGKDYISAGTALRFLSIGVLFSAIFGISLELLSIKGKSKLILFNTSFALIINLFLNYLLVPPYGITGASIATMISLIFLNVLFFFQAYKSFSIIPFRRKNLRIFLILIFSTSILLIIKMSFKINLISFLFYGFFFMALYTLLILTTNCLDKNDWNILKSILQKVRIKKNS